MSTELGGYCPVLVTPFADDGSLDEASLARLAGYAVDGGADALACLGLASEAYKLSDEERNRVIATVVAAAAGRVPVIAGADHTGTEAAAARAADAVRLGASAVMAYPPTFVKPDAAGMADFYTALAEAAGVPVVVQDAPSWTAVPLPVDLLAGLRERAPLVRYVKVESPPVGDKIAALVERGYRVLGGFGSLHLPEEVAAGVIGTMPGAALPRLYAELWRHARDGDGEALWLLHARALPFLSFQMSSLDVLVHVQKLLLAEAGALAGTHVRAPATPLSARQREWLGVLLTRSGVGDYR